MPYDIRYQDGRELRRKSRVVADDHLTKAPAALTIGALNYLKVLECDIQNAYLTANCHNKVWMQAGPDFGSDAGKRMLILRDLYGLKSSGAAFRLLLAETLHDLGYKPTKADPDVWLRPAVNPDGFDYYKLVL